MEPPQPPTEWRQVQKYVRALPANELASQWQALIADAWVCHGAPGYAVLGDVLSVVNDRLIKKRKPVPLPRHRPAHEWRPLDPHRSELVAELNRSRGKQRTASQRSVVGEGR